MSRTPLPKFARRTVGLVFLLVMALFVALTVALYQKVWSDAVLVKLQANRIGNQLNVGSEIKARGVVVGTVREVRATGSGAELTLALEPAKTGQLPKNVSALLVPKTLFGERYVQLSIPDTGRAAPLAEGDVITQDRSSNAVELERVFDDMLPVLQAVQPQKLASTLTAVATALQGRGDQLGDTLVESAHYLEGLNPSLPKLNENIRRLADVTRLYGDIAPDLLDSLTDTAVTMRTVDEKREALRPLYADVTSTSQDLTTFLRNNRNNIIQLSANSRDSLELLARYSPSLPCTLKAMNEFKPMMDQVLGGDGGQPGVHVDALVTQSRGKYVPGADDPAYTAATGPRCYPSGVAPTAGVAATSAPGPAIPLLAGGGDALGLPNSVQEQQVLAPLLAPAMGVPPAEVPGWAGVLVGPLYRGTAVTVR